MTVTVQQLESDLFVVRTDLLQPAGGNKVLRFRRFLQQHPHATRVIAMSDPGSHTFIVLAALSEEFPHIKEWVFLERKIDAGPYQQDNQKRYKDHPAIRVLQDDTWRQLLRLKIESAKSNTAVLGIGGTTKEEDGTTEMMESCLQQLPVQTSPVEHVLPSASGQMLQGLLREAPQSHVFTAVCTGAPLSRGPLKRRFRREAGVRLLTPVPGAEAAAARWEERYHLQLDPIHTAPAIHTWEQARTSSTAVCWLTHPRLLG
ncbi:hypothetical protein [Alkalicoccus chagannorensis]|uniref:hypothetical protein n=1 Tax=Alkalicoccus chagannorensis TaxID=427072 RepID=UPI0004231BD2|nr:hypothetical protein [Alkalicoccus chagannorensis]